MTSLGFGARPTFVTGTEVAAAIRVDVVFGVLPGITTGRRTDGPRLLRGRSADDMSSLVTVRAERGPHLQDGERR